jgi:hypothetical protein
MIKMVLPNSMIDRYCGFISPFARPNFMSDMKSVQRGIKTLENKIECMDKQIEGLIIQISVESRMRIAAEQRASACEATGEGIAAK